ncbi:hypothetical protein GCM10009556_043650 [Acrocarpospora pleiomorpha]
MVQLPADAQAVVVGGGVAGCSVAFHLARLGWQDVILLERHDLTEGTTWHSAGFVGQLRSTVTQTRMIMYSAGLYPELRDLTGLDPGWHGVGGLRLATTPERHEELLRQAGAAETYGLDMDLLDASATYDRMPLLAVDDVLASLWLPGDGWLDPARLGRALAEGARKLGVRIVTGVEVTGIDVENGRVKGVRVRESGSRESGSHASGSRESGSREFTSHESGSSESSPWGAGDRASADELSGRGLDARRSGAHGSNQREVGSRSQEDRRRQDLADGRGEIAPGSEWVIRTDTVVNAAGAAAGVVGRMAGVDVPIVPIKHQYVVTAPSGVPVTAPTVRDPDNIVYFREEGGGILVGGYIRTPDVWEDPNPLSQPRSLFPPNMPKFEESWESARRRLPSLRSNGQIIKVVHGPEAFTPDGEFLLGETSVGGFWVAAGFCVHGLAAAGGVGKVMAEWIVDGQPEYDMFAMDIARFGTHARSATWARAKALDSYSKYYDISYPGEERTAARPLRRSPAWVRHAELGAEFGEKSGWERVNWYDLPNSLRNQGSSTEEPLGTSAASTNPALSGSLPGGAASGGALPGSAASDGVSSGGALPGGTLPGDAAPGGALPRGAASGGDSSDGAVPDGVSSGGALSGGASSDRDLLDRTSVGPLVDDASGDATEGAVERSSGYKPGGWAGRFWSPAIREECLATRDAAGLFDQTSFAKFEISGLAALQRIAGNDLDKAVGSVVYTQLLNGRDGIEADVTVTRLGEDRFRLVTGTAFGGHDMALLRRNGVEVRDVTSAYACYCLWGPKAYSILAGLTGDDLSFGYMKAREISVGYVPVLAQRVTFVGEFGWELYCAAEYGLTLWDTLMAAGVPEGMRPGGYRAIDSMRLEKGYRVWGSDITPETTPLEAGLGFAVRTERRAGMKRPESELACLLLDGGKDVALGGEPVRLDGTPVSRVTSGGYGYRVDRSIAYAYLPPGASRVEVGVNGRWVGADVTTGPVYDPGHERIRATPGIGW